MSVKSRYIWTVLALLTGSPSQAQTNLSFEQGLDGRHITGKAIIVKSNARSGSQCVKIDSGSLFQRIPVSPLAIVQFDVYLKSARKGESYTFLRFYNAKHQLLLEYKSNPVDSLSGIRKR